MTDHEPQHDPAAGGASFEALLEVIAHLRGPDGCPWDREQTHRSLRRYLLEEAYEALEALDNDDLEALREELGDLLLQILLQAQIASETGVFNAAEVAAGIHAKLIRRHPHVFGELELTDVEQVKRNWEHFKEAEKGNQALDGVARSLPALAQAEELQGRAARLGFDRPQIEGLSAKVTEELEEFQAATRPSDRERELGDLLFAIVNYARRIGADPEAALRGANQRFRARFTHMDRSARTAGRRLDQLGMEKLDRLWEAARQEID